jgi:excisionase family DNA binding protein
MTDKPIAGQLSLVDAERRAPSSSAPAPGSEPRGLTRSDLMTAVQVSDLLGVPVSTVREWGRNGALPRVKLGRHVRFIRAQVEGAIRASGG